MMLFLIKKKNKKEYNHNVYTNLEDISFNGRIENSSNVVMKLPEDPTLFSFSLPAARKIEEYFRGTKYVISNERSYPFALSFLKYTTFFPKEKEKLKKFDYNKTLLVDFELLKENSGTGYPFRFRLGFKKELYPVFNIIYTLEDPVFPEFYEVITENITGSKVGLDIMDPKTKKGWAWEFIKYLGMTHGKKILCIDLNEEKPKLRKAIKEKHSDKWFLVFIDELHEITIEQKIAILLISDIFIFDTSYFAYFATKEGIKSYKVGELPFKTSKKSSLSIIQEKDIFHIIR